MGKAMEPWREGWFYTHRLKMVKERNNVGAHPYEVLIMIANEKCNLAFGVWSPRAN